MGKLSDIIVLVSATPPFFGGVARISNLHSPIKNLVSDAASIGRLAHLQLGYSTRG